MTRPTQSLPAAAEERAVAAIVLDHEQAHQEAGGRHREQQRQPIAEPASTSQSGTHSSDQGQRGDHDLDNAARPLRLTVTRQDLRPALRITRERGRGNGRVGGTQGVFGHGPKR